MKAGLIIGSAGLIAGIGAWALNGCTSSLLLNQTASLDGEVTIVVINDTPFRAAFTVGVFNDLEREPIGQVQFEQPRLEAGESLMPGAFPCTRDVAIGTDKLIRRILDTNGDQTQQNFDPDVFTAVVHFSDAPADSDLAALPTVGTAVGMVRRIGVDHSCGDQLIFTLRQDPDAPGGFRIDFQVLHAEDNP
jgi:hypothetical protein